MEVKTTHHIDAGDKDSQGWYQYYYEYDVFCFTDGEIQHFPAIWSTQTLLEYWLSKGYLYFMNKESAVALTVRSYV